MKVVTSLTPVMACIFLDVRNYVQLQFGIPFFPNTVATSEEKVPVFTVDENDNMNQKLCVWSCCHSLGNVAIELQQQLLGSI